jgi:NADPH2 dehydrogenase
MKTFSEYKLKNLILKNRVVMPPMCMNMAEDGHPTDFHYIHYGNAALGEIGLIIVEATGVTPEGRILERDLGLWKDDQIEGHRRIVELAKKYGSHIGIQLGHAGRKCGISSLTTLAPSAIRFSESYPMPKEMTTEDIEHIKKAFREAASRSVEAGYELIELHGAHGYLLHEFLSPLTNKRIDAYGGSRENRVRLIQEIADTVRSVVPEDFPVILRVSASDYVEGGIDLEEMVEIIHLLKDRFDMIHVSSGGLDANQQITVYPGYQVKFSEVIREKCQIPTITVGLITEVGQVEEILQNDRADLVALGRILLRDPFVLINQGQGIIAPLFAYRRGFHVNWAERNRK